MQRRILIVDDSPLNRDMLNNILCREYTVIEAENGRQALDMLTADDYKPASDISAVLLDLMMPVLDGYGVLSAMSADERLSQIPVIVATGRTDDGAEVRALSLGANDYILKPYNPDVILHRLRNTIRLRETAAIVNAARYDSLTGLYSRAAFFEAAEEMISAQEAGYYILASFDIDSFKVINDQYGNKKGDDVLKFIADTFDSGFKKIGGIAARINADHYAILYPASYADSAELAEIRHKVSVLDGSIQPISFSIGRYLVDETTLPMNLMFDRATLAEASVKGKFDTHIAFYDESMRNRLLREQEITREMKDALADGQFEMWLQPQYNHASGALIGAEALVRWRHPSRGLISPGEFIGVFEKNGFIYELDKFVWENAARCLRRWINAGRKVLPISVNVSRYDLLRDDLYTTLNGIVEKYEIQYDLLRLEITESAFAQSSKLVGDAVKRLVSIGFTVEIDDFGSGYSSLNTLKDIPASILKLDMRFLDDENAERGGNIIESIMRMAKWIGMSVIAEGVEYKYQADFLKSIGCSYVQGYLYGKPMPEEEYEALFPTREIECEMTGLVTVENLNSNTFWDPRSMDTLIFNSYVGAACIFEYHAGKIELLRANDKYATELGFRLIEINKAIETAWISHSTDDMKHVFETIRQAIETGEEVSDEMVLVGIHNEGEYTYLHSHMRVIAQSDERWLFYCMIENITAQRNAEEEARHSLQQLTFLNKTAHNLLAHADINVCINHLLGDVLSYFGGSRAYVIELDNEAHMASNTYEVCAPGVESEMEMLKAIPLELVPAWMREINTNGYIYISDVDSLGEERESERETLKAQGIKSLLAVALTRDGVTAGCVGVDDPTLKIGDVGCLAALGDFTAILLTRRDLTAKVSDALSHRQMSFDEMLPFAFEAVMASSTDFSFVKDINSTYICCSRAFAKMVGIDDEREIAGKTDYDLFDRELAEIYINDDKNLFSNGKSLIDHIEKIPSDDGSFRYSSTSKYLLYDAEGNVIGLYGVGRDVTEERAVYARLKLLTDSIPCGLATFVCSPNSIRMIYFNEGFCELIGYSRAEYELLTRKNMPALVFDEDKDGLLEHLRMLLDTDAPIDYIFRIRLKSGGFKSINIKAASSDRRDDTITVHAVFFDASERR